MLGAARRPPMGGAINAYADHRQTTASHSGSKKRRPENSGSKLLTNAENQLMFEILGSNRISLAAAVVQLLRASGGQWQHLHVGVVSLVKDYERKLYALKLFDIYNGNMLWEQVLYKNFSVKSYINCRKLLSFESDDCVFGLNFSDDSEALNLKHHLDKRYEAERGQKDLPGMKPMMPSTPTRNPQQTNHHSTTQKFQSPGFTDVGSMPHISVGHGSGSTAAAASKKKAVKEQQKKKKAKISKEDIGYPTNFEHKCHLGWDDGVGFSQSINSSEPLDDSIVRLLKVAGENPDRMSRDELLFARNFIDKYAPIDETSPAPSSAPLPPPVPQPTYPQSTLGRNGGVQQQQRNTGFSMAPNSSTPQQTRHHHQQNYPTPTQHPHSYPTPVKEYQPSPAMPPPAPTRDSSIYVPQQRQYPAPSRPPPMERPPPPTYPPMEHQPKGASNYDRGYPTPTPAQQPLPIANNNVSANAPRPGPPPPPPPPSTNLKPTKIAVAANAPPPPPPPPASLLSSTPQPTGNGVSQGAAPKPAQPAAEPDGRQSLLAEIQAGKRLKHVDPPVERSPFAGKETSVDGTGDGRDQMMQQIKKGAQLKHVDAPESENRKSAPSMTEISGIAGALARALELRRKNMSISDDSDNSDGNDSEWAD